MDLRLTGKNALITGASKGIGKATAKCLALEGCNLVLVARTAADLEACKAEIEAATPVRVDIAVADFSKGSEVERVSGAFREIDILVNNAGAIPGGDLLAVDETRWREAWDLKVFGYINACRAYYRLMKARGRGVIVNIIGAGANSKNSSYICGATGNSTLDAFTRALGSTSHKDGIRVVGIHPGAVATERLISLEKQGAKLPRETMPLGRPATPDEIAQAVAFLASDLSAYTSGTVVTIDGGLTASLS